MKNLHWKHLIFLSFLIQFTSGKTLIGGFCINSADCVGDPGVTSECWNSRCLCRFGFVASIRNDDCFPLAKKLGDRCEEPPQCQELGTPPGEFTDCKENQCVCKKEISVPSESQEKCLEVINEVQGKPCVETQQCTAGLPGDLSECVEEPFDPPTEEKKCFCTTKAVNFNNHCYLKAVAVGEICEFDAQCQAGLGRLSRCEGGEIKHCICPTATSVPNGKNDECLPIVNIIGGSCREDIQCTKGNPGNHSECSDGACNCMDDSVNEPGNNICYKKAELVGEPCKIDRQCSVSLGERSECLIEEGNDEGECSCTSGNVASSDKKRCVKGGIPIGEPCEKTTECMGEPGTSECALNSCGCVGGFIPSTGLDDCLQKINETGGECREVKQCQQGDLGELSNCFQISPGVAICNCTEDAITEPNEKQLCRKKAVHVGDPCEVLSQCSASLGHSECLKDKCACVDKFIPSTNNTACLLKSFLNDPCEDNNQCNWIPQSPNSTSCQLKDASHPDDGSICRCNSDFINPEEKYDACFPLAQSIGDDCTNDDIQCKNLVNAICSPEKLCSCSNSTHVPSANGRVCLDRVEKLNSTCSETPQCSPLNSECFFNATQNQMFCMCLKDEYIESLNRPGNCLQIINETRLPCEEKVQCSTGLGSDSDCVGNFCECSTNYQYFEGTCYYPVGLDGRCKSNGECQVGVNKYTYCNSESRCRCAPGTVQFEDKCFRPTYVGDACDSHNECTFSIQGPVYCNPTTRMCTCQLGYSGSFENSICSSAIQMLSSPTGILAFIFVAGWMSKLG